MSNGQNPNDDLAHVGTSQPLDGHEGTSISEWLLPGDYARFREDVHLEGEKDVTAAIERDAPLIERSFTTQWELNRNLSGKKTLAQLRHDMWALDYGDQEIERIEQTFVEDSPIFRLIRCFVNDIYLDNLRQYVARRRHYIAEVPRSVFLVCGASPLILLVGAVTMRASGVGTYAHYAYAAVGVAFVLAFGFLFERAWSQTVPLIKNSRADYSQSINHSVHILDRNLQEITDKLRTRMRDAGDRLEKLDLTKPGDQAFAQKLIGYILRLRERKTAHRDYYRASIDRFVKSKAQLLYWHQFVRRVQQAALWLLVLIFSILMLVVIAISFRPDGFALDVLVSLAFLFGSGALLATGAAVWARHVFGSKEYTSNVDDVVTACLKNGAWVRDSVGDAESGVDLSRFDLVILKAIQGSNISAVNQAVYAQAQKRSSASGPPSE